MLPAIKYTQYTSPSGNTQIYIVRRKQQNPLIKRVLLDRKYALSRQKMLGLALLVIGIVGMCVFKEDATAGIVLAALGCVRLASVEK